MKRHALVAVALVLFTRGAAAVEPSRDDLERARTFFDAGAMAYSAARYGDAVRAFERAYEIAPRPQILFSLAQAERKEFLAVGDQRLLRRALEHYRAYLSQVESGGRRAEAIEAKGDLEGRLARMDPQQANAAAAPEKRRARVTVYSETPHARVTIDNGAPQELPFFGDLDAGRHRVRVFAEGYFDAEQEVSGDRPVDVPVNLPLREKPALVGVVLTTAADVYVDGRIVATTPIDRPVEVEPGPHVLSVAANGKKAFSQEVTLERGKAFRFQPTLERSGQRTASFVMLGAGGIAALAAGGFAIGALASESSAEDIASARRERNISAEELTRHNDRIEDRDTYRTIAIVSGSVGAALLLGGAFLYAFDKPPVAVVPPRSREPSPKKEAPGLEMGAAPVLGPGLVGAAMTARF